MTAYYNENDPKAAEWLRQLILEGQISPGHVDERSIEDVTPADLSGYVQHHFFAGIGGWPYALRLAGWPDDRPVWTGSCPCGPFSQAGLQKEFDDPRHLWPDWRWLVDQRRPSVIFGEQVASPAGRRWYTGVRADLERMGFEVGCADLCAAGVGAPHRRQRLYWVANTKGERREWSPNPRREKGRRFEHRGGMGYTDGSGSQGWQVLSERFGECSPWATSLGNWISFNNGKARRIEPGIEPLVDGIPGRVGFLRGYGNAIVPWLAAAFVMAADQTGQDR